MPAILAWIARSWVGKLALEFLWGKLVGLFTKLAAAAKAEWDRRQLNKKIKEDAEASVDPLKKAKTKEEIDAATDDALDGV